LKEYNEKLRKFDSMWLMMELKKITARVDIKMNTVLAVHEQMVSFSPSGKEWQSQTKTTCSVSREGSRVWNL